MQQTSHMYRRRNIKYKHCNLEYEQNDKNVFKGGERILNTKGFTCQKSMAEGPF